MSEYDAKRDAALSYDVAIAEMRRRKEWRDKLTAAKRFEFIGNCMMIEGDCLEVMPQIGKVDAVVDNSHASYGQQPHEQHAGQFGSALFALPQQPPQTAMVEFPQGWAILTDPPYGIGEDGGRFRGRKGQGHRVLDKKGWDKSRPSDVVFSNILSANCPSIIWGGNYFADLLPPSKGWLYWDKLMGGDFADGELAWSNLDRALRKYTECNKAAGKLHPTQKPIGLMRWCLGFLPDAKTILDPFMGSGTTGVACVRTGRHFIGIELDPDYFEIACRRVREAYAQPDLLIDAPKAAPQVQEAMEL